MAHPIQLPRLGWSMEQGTFVAWLKQPGESVAVGEPLFEMEGEKALQQIESTDAGILHLADPAPSAGQSLPVGALLGWLLAPGESPPATSDPNPAAENQATDRAHRIGQDKAVFVYKLIARNTVEEKVQKLQQFKQGLADQLFAGGKGQLWQGSAVDLLSLFAQTEPTNNESATDIRQQLQPG